jgi:four helix bundle protein
VEFFEKLREMKMPYPLCDQLLRAATSIGANVVEAKSSHSRKDYIKYFEIALKSANETKYWLIIVKRTRQTAQEVANLLSEAEEIANILASSIMTMKNNK